MSIGISNSTLSQAIRSHCWICCGKSIVNYSNCGGSVEKCGELFTVKNYLKNDQTTIFDGMKTEFFEKAVDFIKSRFQDGFWWDDARQLIEKEFGYVPSAWYGGLAQRLLKYYRKKFNVHRQSGRESRNSAQQFYYESNRFN